MHVSIHAFTAPKVEKNIGTLKYCEDITFDEIKLNIYSIFNLWIRKYKISHAVCKILFIHSEGIDKEWVEWQWGFSAVKLEYFHEIYLYDNKQIIPLDYVE